MEKERVTLTLELTIRKDILKTAKARLALRAMMGELTDIELLCYAFLKAAKEL